MLVDEDFLLLLLLLLPRYPPRLMALFQWEKVVARAITLVVLDVLSIAIVDAAVVADEHGDRKKKMMIDGIYYRMVVCWT